MTKVKDLLRENQESALIMNKADIEKMFNFGIGGSQIDSHADNTSKFYFDKIAKSREKLKKILPLFLQSKGIIKRHKKCLNVI